MKSKFCIRTVLSASLLFPCLANAFYENGIDALMMPPSSTPMPENCVFGKAKPDSDGRVTEVSLSDINNAYQSGKDLYNSGGTQSAQENFTDAKTIYELGNSLSAMWEDSQYLRIEGPKYVAQGVKSRFKANLKNIGSTVQFYNNELGRVGSDKSNFETNAYYSLKFDREHGAGLVWITRGGLCSAKGVWVQKLPKITAGSINPGRSLTVKYEFDTFSQAAIEKKDATINIYAKTERADKFVSVGSVNTKNRIGTVTLTPSGYRPDQGMVTFYAEIDDGKFKSERVPVGQNESKCPTGVKGSYQSAPVENLMPRAPCGFDSRGYECPYSLHSITSTTYPIIEYRCQ